MRTIPWRLFGTLIGGLISLALAGADPASANEQVDLELVLAVDVSGSMDPDEQALQRTGYVEAIRHPDVLAAIRSGLHGRIAVTYLEWAGPGNHRVVIPWRTLTDTASAEAFAAQLSDAPRGTLRGTSISSGLTIAASLFEGNGYEGMRRVIDVSGDGPNNMGEPILPVRDMVVRLGIVINGLPITLKPGNRGYGSIENLDSYYENCVIGGPGAFIVAVNDRAQLVEAIRRKLVLEIADLSGGFEHVQASPVPDSDYDCEVGEKQRRMWLDP
ncbi:DUF1194 domain-containing protein [Chthonobacter rhizosphaerae]|uniref:DUF1194 domain-containing protein n=1 Tax=Chthonobacter rhizosphaerae TaxID=2735553 RepID=UPI0015EEFBBF|nr:DUF1194 domain-containing protein [Chthonobacter rhizosphaerae]